MNLFEEAVIYSTVMHAGKMRKQTSTPFILHPLEVSQIISTITDDIEVITAGVLHDIVEDTDGTIEEIKSRFGERVAMIVDAETEDVSCGEHRADNWKARKETSLTKLENSHDIGIKILWLADKLANIRAVVRIYSEIGNEVWNGFHQKDPKQHKWYYQTVAELIEIDLNRTGAFKEYVRLINTIWPGTFDSDKTKYKKFRELSVEGCKVIGKGAKGTVYRYDDELVVKVYNEYNLYKEIERENYLARKAFVAGIPTAISFGIVTVGEKYGSLFELLDSDCVSNLIANNPDNVEAYAKAMAEIALQIHSTSGKEIDLPDFTEPLRKSVVTGVSKMDKKAAERIIELIDQLPKVETMIHGDLHTGNVMVQGGEYLLIDMDRLSICHPIVEIANIYLFYVGFGELDPNVIENFMGFSYDTSKQFWKYFMEYYYQTKDEEVINSYRDKAALLCYVRMIRKCYDKGAAMTFEEKQACEYYMGRIKELLKTVDTLE